MWAFLTAMIFVVEEETESSPSIMMIVILVCVALVVVLLAVAVVFLVRKRRGRSLTSSVEAIPMEYPSDQKMAFGNGRVKE